MSIRLVKRKKSSKGVWRWGRGCPRKCLVAPVQPPRSRESGSPTPNAHSTGWWAGAGACFCPARQPHGVEGSGHIAEGAFALERSGAVPPRLRPEGHVLGVWWQLLLSWTGPGGALRPQQGQLPSPCPLLPLSEQVLRADGRAPSKLPTLFLKGSQLGLRRALLTSGRTWPPSQHRPQMWTLPCGFPSLTHPALVTLDTGSKSLPRKGGESSMLQPRPRLQPPAPPHASRPRPHIQGPPPRPGPASPCFRSWPASPRVKSLQPARLRSTAVPAPHTWRLAAPHPQRPPGCFASPCSRERSGASRHAGLAGTLWTATTQPTAPTQGLVSTACPASGERCETCHPLPPTTWAARNAQLHRPPAGSDRPSPRGAHPLLE